MTSSNGRMFKTLCINTLALPYKTSNDKFPLLYLIYLNLVKDHFWLRDLGLSTVRHVDHRMTGRLMVSIDLFMYLIRNHYPERAYALRFKNAATSELVKAT